MGISFGTFDGNTVDDGTSFISIAPQTTGQFGVVCVGISQATNAATVSSIADTANSVWTFRIGSTNSTGLCRTEIWTCSSMLGNSVTVTVTLSAAADAAGNFIYYNGVVGVGNTTSATGSSARPTVSLTMQDWNNLVIGSLVYQNGTSKGLAQSTGEMLGFLDPSGTLLIGQTTIQNQSISPQSLTCAASLTSSDDWAAAAIELRSVITPTPSVSWFTA